MNTQLQIANNSTTHSIEKATPNHIMMISFLTVTWQYPDPVDVPIAMPTFSGWFVLKQSPMVFSVSFRDELHGDPRIVVRLSA